jgi:complement component 1 Q subcomponent-binding protein
LIEAETENSRVAISDFYYLENKEWLEPQSFEAEKKSADAYPGPSFANLDEDLQALVETYVADRGVNEELASFVVEYIDWKEQREYITWLDSKFSSMSSR